VRGEVYQLKKPRDAQGHEQQGARYAVVVQASYLTTSTWIVAPTSTSAQPTSYRPEIEVRGRTTRVLIEQMAAADTNRLGNLVGTLNLTDMQAIDQALRDVLDL
jgi:mRNA interferase MazF